MVEHQVASEFTHMYERVSGSVYGFVVLVYANLAYLAGSMYLYLAFLGVYIYLHTYIYIHIHFYIYIYIHVCMYI